ITETTDSIAKLKEEKENKNFKKENLAKNKEHFDKELAEKQAELNKITQTLSSKAKEIEEKKKIIEENTELKYELQQKLNEQEITIKNSNDRIKQLEKDLVSIISNLDRNRIIKNERLLQFKEIENNRNKSIVELSAKQEQINQIELKIKSFDEKINLYQSEKRIKESKVKFLEELEREKEGYAKAVKSIITECEKNHEIKQGYKGVIANIIKVDNRYATAIEMLLGASIQNIVTKAEQDAKTMIEYLRNNNLGRASFLPMTTVKGNKLDRYKSVDGTIGIASDLISYEKEYDGIMQNLLGKAVIVDSMENAIKLAKENRYSFRIATLEGDIITPSGSMTGGSIAKKTSNILGRTEEIKTLKQEVIKLENLIKQLEEQKEEFSKSNAEQIESIEKLKAEMQQNEIIFATEQEKMNSINKEVTSLENEKNKKQQEIINHNKNIETSNNNKNQFLEEIEKIVENSRKLNEEITEYAQKHQADQDKIDILNEDITNLKISVSSFEESNLSIDEIIERITSEIESKTINIESHKKEIIQLKEKNEELSQLIKALEESILKIKSEVENSQQRQDELKQQRIKENEKISELEKTIEKQFEIIRDIKEQIVKIGMKETNINEAITTLINELWTEYEITPNNAKQFERPTNIKKVEEDVKKLREEIKQLGSINIDSIEEYKRTEERYTQMNEQRYDLETTIAKLHEVIVQMTETMKKRFKEKFEIINKNFNETFKELFGGGMAKVALEDENNILDCGIDIQVQPTGKKLQNMMLLSGGERALTAIALLFAILKINPSPFCILDEIEAALDDVNVYRYADYLKKLNKLTQFLIITHRKGSMEAAGAVYGVTMEENGISKMLSISLKK
ncbi:MAG: chromosome segregation protein SMC, partial [Clostridiales bacterium]|nr:chromosome segregation protein SMC [Clostridiales bacterium]